MLEFGVVTTISPSPERDHVKVQERYPVPTHLPRTQTCCAGHADGQAISNNNNDDSSFGIYDFGIDLPVVVVVVVDVLVDVLVDVVVTVDNVVVDVTKKFQEFTVFCMYYINSPSVVVLAVDVASVFDVEITTMIGTAIAAISKVVTAKLPKNNERQSHPDPVAAALGFLFL